MDYSYMTNVGYILIHKDVYKGKYHDIDKFVDVINLDEEHYIEVGWCDEEGITFSMSDDEFDEFIKFVNENYVDVVKYIINVGRGSGNCPFREPSDVYEDVKTSNYRPY